MGFLVWVGVSGRGSAGLPIVGHPVGLVLGQSVGFGATRPKNFFGQTLDRCVTPALQLNQGNQPPTHERIETMNNVFVATVETPEFPFFSFTVIDTNRENALKTLRETWEAEIAKCGSDAGSKYPWPLLEKNSLVACEKVEIGKGKFSWNLSKAI